MSSNGRTVRILPGSDHRTPTALIAIILLLLLATVAGGALLAGGHASTPSAPSSSGAFAGAVVSPSPTREGPHLFAVRGPTDRPASPAPTPGQTCNSGTGCGPLLYNGGPVMHHPQVVLLFWQPNGTTFETPSADPYAVQASDASYRSIMQGFFLNSSGSYWLGIAQQYTDSLGAPGTSVSVWGSFLDTHPFPCGACGSGDPLQDSQVEAEIQSFISTHGSPTGSNAEYFVFLPLHVYECASGECSFTTFCAYHSNFLDSASAQVIYALMPDVGTAMGGCAATLDTAYPYGPNGDQVADWELNVVSHEFMESITDPEPNSGWVSSSGWEVGDLCAWVWTAPPSYQDLTDFLFDGHPYFLQPEWSNSANNCQQQPLPTGPSPSVVTSVPSALSAGGTAELFLNATLAKAAANWGNVSVEFPTDPSVSLISVVAAGTTFPSVQVLAPGHAVAGCYSLCSGTESYPAVVASSTGWATGRTYSLQVAVTVPTAGSFPVLVKAVTAAGPSDFATDWVPTGTSTVDALGENVTQYTIPVTGSSDYRVDFAASGLLSGSLWSVTWNGRGYTTTTSSLAIYATNGSYPFVVSASGWNPSPSNGTVAVNGSAVTVPIAFSRVTYPVTVAETGLPGGTVWWLNLSSGLSHSSNGTGMAFTEPNGTFAYTLASANSAYSAPGGRFTINGSGAALTAPFSIPTYPLTFEESGLPAGTSWSVAIAGTTASSRNSTVVVAEANGTYPYLIVGTPGYLPTPRSGSATVRGSPLTLAVSFSLATYPVTISELSFPNGTLWWVNLTGGPNVSATLPSTSLSLPNGTYSYVAGCANSTFYDPSTSSFTVNGGPVNLSIRFRSYVSTVTVTESGLPSGTEWWMNVSGLPAKNVTGSVLLLPLPNGTYSFVAGSSNAGYRGTPGSFEVTGGPTPVSVAFARVTFSVRWNETGLPTGTVWWANVSGGPSLESTSGRAVADLGNGSYTVSFASANRSYAAPGSILLVQGGPTEQSVAFGLVTYLVSVTETGLPSGTNWSIVLAGGTLASTTGSIIVPEPNGSFLFSVGAVPGYAATPRTGWANVSGNATDVRIDFQATGGTGFLGTSLSAATVFAGLVVTVAAGVVIVAVLRHRRSRRSSAGGKTGSDPPPPSRSAPPP